MSDDETWSFEEIDAKIHYYESAAMDLKIRRNKRAPMNMLPREMLLEIFLAVRDLDQKRTHQNGLLRVTQVCALWRDIAINAGVLWTRPPAQNCRSEWTKLALKRSKRAPLDILLDLDYSRNPNVAVIFRQAWRIKTLHITGQSYNLSELHEQLPRRSPQLQDLKISCEADDDDDEDEEDDEEIQERTLPSTAFQDSPKLRRLTIENVYFSFEMLDFTNLISLSLKPLTRNPLPSWIQLTDILRRMTLLEELRLDGGFPPSDAHVPHMQPINMPRLKALQIHTQALSQLQTFMSLMICPNLENLSLDWDTYTSPEHVETMFRTAAALIDAAKHGSHFTTLEISETVNDLTQTRCVARSVRGYSVDISFPTNPAELGTMEGIRELVRALRLGRVTHLSLAPKYCLYLNLRVLLGDLSLLKTACIRGKTAFLFFECLAPMPVYTSHGGMSWDVCLPELKSITWRGSHFTDPVWVHENVEDILERRTSQGASLEQLTFRNVKHLTPDLVEIFQTGIARVVVESK